jgi:Cell division protein ZapA.
VEKRRIRLEINGIVCGLITEESDEYMHSLAGEVEAYVKKILASSPLMTKESAAMMAALSFCDSGKKSDDRLYSMKQRVLEMEKKTTEAQRVSGALKKENSQLWEETDALLSKTEKPEESEELQELRKKIEVLKEENKLLRSGRQQDKETEEFEEPDSDIKLKNPLRHDDSEQKGFTSFFEKSNEA